MTPAPSHPQHTTLLKPVPAILGLLLLEACASAPPRTPQLLPLSGPTLNSTLEAQASPLVLLNVWSSWCAPCLKEIPDLLALQKRFHPRVRLVLVTIDQDQDAAMQVLQDNGVSFPSYIQRGDTQAFIEAVHPKWSGTLPVTVIFDRQGERLAYWRGPIKPAQLEGRLKTLLAQRSAPKMLR